MYSLLIQLIYSWLLSDFILCTWKFITHPYNFLRDIYVKEAGVITIEMDMLFQAYKQIFSLTLNSTPICMALKKYLFG